MHCERIAHGRGPPKSLQTSLWWTIMSRQQRFLDYPYPTCSDCCLPSCPTQISGRRCQNKEVNVHGFTTCRGKKKIANIQWQHPMTTSNDNLQWHTRRYSTKRESRFQLNTKGKKARSEQPPEGSKTTYPIMCGDPIPFHDKRHATTRNLFFSFPFSRTIRIQRDEILNL